ncbi:MAG: hypothetical protein LBO76_06660, partial [Treponema sp.]|nr:hypothetical protein [Treponema sp.]
FIEKVARAKVALDLTKGLGDANKDHTAWALALSLGWSLKEKPGVAPGDIGTGFVVKYKAGIAEDPYDAGTRLVTPGKTTTNQLYFGFIATF